MINYGCKFGQPHDVILLNDSRRVKWEVCKVCNKKFRWIKGFKERIDNVEYLKVHARNYAQKGGATNRLFMKLYETEKTTIII